MLRKFLETERLPENVYKIPLMVGKPMRNYLKKNEVYAKI